MLFPASISQITFNTSKANHAPNGNHRLSLVREANSLGLNVLKMFRPFITSGHSIAASNCTSITILPPDWLTLLSIRAGANAEAFSISALA